MASSTINQKEYLKRYLSGGKGSTKKKKKDKQRQTETRVKIIDDDDDVVTHIHTAEEAEELLGGGEDAPQIVGVIDDRPLSLRIDDYRKSDLWKPMGDEHQNEDSAKKQSATQQLSFSISKNKVEMLKKEDSKYKLKPDLSPPRKRTIDTSRDRSPPRKRTTNTRYLSPPRKKTTDTSRDLSPPRKKTTETSRDLSPPRKRTTETRDLSPIRKRTTDTLDLSPPRKRTTDTSRDLSPPRKRTTETRDLSPIRKRTTDTLDLSPLRKRTTDTSRDLTPPRKTTTDNSKDVSPPRHSRWDSPSLISSSKDLSPTRIKSSTARERSEDMSPPRRRRFECNDEEEKNVSPPGLKKPDSSPPRKRVFHESIDEPGVRKNKYVIPQKRIITDKMERTLEGKKAGLQNAQELIKENEAFKIRENKMFESLNEEVSGKSAKVVMRDRKTGKIRDLNKEAEEKKKKEETDAKNKEKYVRWGKGLKQVEDQNEKIQQDLYEMSKPLARYADDDDLENFLKEQEREGDPMLAYIRKKKKKVDIESGRPEKPMYQGEFMPNRFGIPPGHRWDGVDRSNGYEKRWFEVQNSQRAQQEEIYKWSTEDM